MSAPRLLELFGGEGGATRGYQRAGFEVYSVDLEPRTLRRSPATGTHVGDAIAVLASLIAGERIAFTLGNGDTVLLGLFDFAAIHASPPCQGYTIATAGNPAARAKHQRLIAATRALLVTTGLPWVIENVEQAIGQMKAPITLCGRMFGLTAVDADGLPLVLDRHRLFESNFPLTYPAHPSHVRDERQVAGVYGGSRRARRSCPRDGRGRIVCKQLPCEHETYATLAPRDRHAARVERGGGYVPRSIRVQQELLGIDWMTVKGMQESIPPVYAEYVGRQLRTVALEPTLSVVEAAS